MNPKKGSILILTLWVLSFLIVFNIGLARNASSQIGLASYLQDRLKMYYLAKAGIERGIVELQAAGEEYSYSALNQTWADNQEFFKEFPIGGGYMTLSYQLNTEEPITFYGSEDESSRININKVPLEVLKTLLENVGGVKTEEAGDIAGAIVDWRDVDIIVSPGGAEDLYYHSLEMPYPCKNGNFQVLEELLLVKGMTPEIFSKLKDTITVYGDGKININTAGCLTLQALGLSSGLSERIIEFRQAKDEQAGEGEAGNVFKTVGELRNIGSLFTEESIELNRVISLGLFTVTSDVFRIRSSGILKKGDRRLQRNITCVVQRNEKEEPQILYWRED
ncbi:MAG: general secretion pathway protein GspK [Candidatus Omnitrophota bacterium]|nr:general secretion pathway protein GspK [Candidatus Omnitrophota bacterium]